MGLFDKLKQGVSVHKMLKKAVKEQGGSYSIIDNLKTIKKLTDFYNKNNNNIDDLENIVFFNFSNCIGKLDLLPHGNLHTSFLPF